MTDPSLYKKAQETVLKRYATEPAERGQSQEWKIGTIAQITATPDEQLTDYDIRTFHSFMEDVEAEMNNTVTTVVPPIKKLREPLAVVEKKPAGCEPSLPENPHGIDLGWN